MTGHRELQCTVHPFGTLNPLRFVVVCSFYEGKMLLSYHEKHQSWETQGGHIEAGETPEDAARRELYEESGVTDAEMIPVCDYFAYDSDGSANGRVYAAIIHQLGQLPPNEMSRIQKFDAFPENLTYPFVTPILFLEAKKELQSRTNSIEINELMLKDLQPSQFYISERKLKDIESWFNAADPSSFTPIPVKWLDGRPVMTDGHTRAVAALKAGLTSVPLIWDEDELDWDMYRVCVAACHERKIFSLVDLLTQIISETDYKEKWDKWCDSIHAEVEQSRMITGGHHEMLHRS